MGLHPIGVVLPVGRMNAVLRWKNGDRQFVDLEVAKKPLGEILYKVGENHEGDRAVGDVVAFQMDPLPWSLHKKLVYHEV